MNMSHSQTNPPKNEIVPVSARDEAIPVPAQDEIAKVSRKSIGTMSAASPKSTGITREKVKRALRWVLTCLPLGGIAWASFLPLQTWMQQALILVALIWFYVFFLLDTFFLGG
jgi:hypothetical protein